VRDLFQLPLNHIQRLIRENSGSIVRTIIYTIGHFLIAATCVWYFTGTNFVAAITDAIVEPLINAVWYFILDRYWATRIKNKREEKEMDAAARAA
jgi:uncharacterized membrane protein